MNLWIILQTAPHRCVQTPPQAKHHRGPAGQLTPDGAMYIRAMVDPATSSPFTDTTYKLIIIIKSAWHFQPKSFNFKVLTRGPRHITFAKPRCRKTKKAYRCSKLVIPCLIAEGIQRWFFAISGPLWPRIKVKVIQTSISVYVWPPQVYRHTKFECNSLNIVRDIAS